MQQGHTARAASLLELAAQRGRDATVLLRLATVRRVLGDLPGAASAAAAAVELAPRNFLMTMLLASLREATGATHFASRIYRAALEHVPLDTSFQPALERQLDHARAMVAAEDRWQATLLDCSIDAVNCSLDEDQKARMRGFRSNILDNLDAGPLVPPKFTIPGLRGRTYFDPSEFSGVQEVAAAADVSRDEFLAIAEGLPLDRRSANPHSAEQDLGLDGRWSMIPLLRNGEAVPFFADRCPVTMDLASRLSLPILRHISPSLYFSVLEAGAHIPPHGGITNARAIAHFPLIVPEDCGFTVGGETREWRIGEPLIFDDMTTHEAWNNSGSTRVVLIADLWRPELGAGERDAVSALMGRGLP